MKTILSEKNIVVALFVMVLITFSFAREDSKKKMTQIYSAIAAENSSKFLTQTHPQQFSTPASPVPEK
jgi:hypothetical protein